MIHRHHRPMDAPVAAAAPKIMGLTDDKNSKQPPCFCGMRQTQIDDRLLRYKFHLSMYNNA